MLYKNNSKKEIMSLLTIHKKIKHLQMSILDEQEMLNFIIKDYVHSLKPNDPGYDVLTNVHLLIRDDISFNAKAYEFDVKAQSYQVSISIDLIKFLKITSKLFSALLLSDSTSNSEYINMVFKGFERMNMELVEDYIKNNTPDSHYSQFLSIAKNLYVASVAFIVAHECCHHVLSHTSKNAKHRYNSKQMEFHADYGAFLLIYRVGYDYESMGVHLDIIQSVMFLFMNFEILRKSSGEKNSSTHPSNRKRYLRYLGYLKPKTVNNFNSYVAEFLKVCSLLDKKNYWNTPGWWRIHTYDWLYMHITRINPDNRIY